jgi:phenylalanine-4-hydroxylase
MLNKTNSLLNVAAIATVVASLFWVAANEGLLQHVDGSHVFAASLFVTIGGFLALECRK